MSNQINPTIVAAAELHATLASLKAEGYDFLEVLTGVDWGEEGLGVVYSLTKTATGEMTHVKSVCADKDNPYLDSACDLWAVAGIYEREAYDFYGIKFLNNPDCRRVFLREDWIGFPFRKDYDESQNPEFFLESEPISDKAVCFTLAEDGKVKKTETPVFGKNDYVVNIGPQHPSTHGVLHFRTRLDGETVTKIDAHMGYIHRGIEKLSEGYAYPQCLALTDRMDYLGAMQTRHALCMCVEQALGIKVSDRVQVIRTIMDELQRIDSHLLFFSCLAQDLGATTAFLYGFRDREEILKIFEKTCGGRLILNYNMIGGVAYDLHPDFVKDVHRLIDEVIPHGLKEYHEIFTGNVIFQTRAKGVGVLSKDDVISYGCTGGTGRASGWHCDLRKLRPYAAYDRVKFNEITFEEGDSMARYMVRMKEIEESCSIIRQLIDNIPEGSIQEKMKPIIKVPEGTYYSAVEGSRGILGVYLESKGDKTPYRLHYRSTGLPLVNVMDKACCGHLLADLITIGGTIDYIIPDVDR